MTSLFSTLNVILDFTEKEQVTFPPESIIKKMFWSAKQESKTSNCGTGGLVSFEEEKKKKISEEVINLLQKIT